MFRSIVFVAFCLFVSAFGLARASGLYSNFGVLRILNFDLNNAEQFAAVKELRSHYKDWQVNDWSNTDYMFPMKNLALIEEFLHRRHLNFTLVHRNVQDLIDAETQRLSEARLRSGYNSGGLDFFSDYHNYADVINFFDNFTLVHPELVTKFNLGLTYEKNNEYGYHFSLKTSTPKVSTIFYEGGIHAREWIAISTMSYIAYKLIDGYEKQDPAVLAILSSFDFFIIPIVNVDGYIYTWTTDRMWRKTRSPNAGSSCVGTDPNRNWGDHWCEAGADPDPCQDDYCGPKAFSEACVINVANFILAWQNNSTYPKINTFIDFHSYSQLWMRPYGWSATPPKDANLQSGAGKAAVAAIKANSKMVYGEGDIYTTIYPASGSSADWGYDYAGIIYAYGVELRDTGRYGFLLPADQIIPTGEEIFAATQALINFILQQNERSKPALPM